MRIAHFHILFAEAAIAAAALAGVVTPARAGDAVSPRVPALLAALDANRDGRLTLEELDADREQQFARFDQDGDGRLSAAEYQALWLDAAQERLDTEDEPEQEARLSPAQRPRTPRGADLPLSQLLVDGSPSAPVIESAERQVRLRINSTGSLVVGSVNSCAPPQLCHGKRQPLHAMAAEVHLQFGIVATPFRIDDDAEAEFGVFHGLADAVTAPLTLPHPGIATTV